MVSSIQSLKGLLLVLNAVFPTAQASLTREPRELGRRDLMGTSNVFLGDRTGAPKNMASGILLGLPLNGSQIPDHFLSDVGFNNMRSGGSQLGEPRRGWTRGYEEFLGRYESLKSDYEVTRRHGGGFQIMIHDMWGIDSYGSPEEVPYPGDNGSYEDFDNFLDTFFELLIQDDMVENVRWDIWNEPDNGEFGNRGLDRYLEYYVHAHQKIVRDFPGGKTTGPSFGRLPNFAGDMINWFTEWASRVAENDAVPDQVSLHFLYGDGDLTTSINQFVGILSDAGINYNGTWNIQEYGNPDQQIPSTAVWNIAQLERHNAPGLRANWRGGLELHDLLANLLGKEGSGDQYDINDVDYWPAREYPVYVYYHQEMTGERVRTEMTEDTLADSFAVIDDSARRVRILAGSRPQTGTWNIQVNDLDTVGLAESGNIMVRTIKFNTAPGIYDRVADPEDLGTSTVAYQQNNVILEVRQTDPAEAWAFELEF